MWFLGKKKMDIENHLQYNCVSTVFVMMVILSGPSVKITESKKSKTLHNLYRDICLCLLFLEICV